MASSRALGKSDDFRRKWDADEYEKIAKERMEEEERERQSSEKSSGRREPKVHRELLKPRDYKVDLDSKLGKSQVITKAMPTGQQGGYYCNVCDCVVKDSINFLDHINGKKHQRNLGMSMKVEKSTVDQVRQRLAMKKKQKEEEKRAYDFEERMKELMEEEEKQRSHQKEKRKAKKRKPETNLDEFGPVDPDLASTMGIQGFGGGK